ncbi:MAG: M48 family metalloprotease [Candidatus Korobacteraceae bacterium]|jgi:predicted Zn-dependent protease
MRRLLRLTALLAMVPLFSMCYAQIPGFGHKDKPAQKTSDKPPEYSDKDKQELAELAQKPEVKARIELAWQELRRRDMDLAYRVNLSTRFAQTSDIEAVQLQQFGVLYDNPILQRYVNTIGQRLVPKDSPNLYAFRILLDPVPRAESLSTGTVYVSTGLIALLDDEAQLSYVLAHEIAHVENNHFYERLHNAILEEELAAKKESDVEKKRAMLSLASGAVGGAIGGAVAGKVSTAIFAGAFSAGSTYVLSSLFVRNKFEPTNWSTVYEDQADEEGLKYMLAQNYDAREIPRLYAHMDKMVTADARVGLGFMGDPVRVKERTANIQKLLATTYKAELQERLKSAGLTGSSPEFGILMAELKRDNGAIALDYDLFAMARDNLEEAVSLRSDDPNVHYYLGKVISLTGRTPEDKQEAMKQFLQAVKYDAQRGAYPQPHLEYAMDLIAQNNPALHEEIKRELKTYVILFQRDHAGQVPPNMNILYDYFLLAGDVSWYVPPVAAVSTRYVDPLNVNTAKAPAFSPADLMQTAGAPAPANEASPPKGQVKRTSKQ